MENSRKSSLVKSILSFPLLIIFNLFFLLVPTAVLSDDVLDLTELSIEELMNIEITSVSKKPQKLSEAAAAVFVITQEDIRRSGVTSIPEALRMVPGLQVAKIDANKWAVTSRGFNGRFANKLLVLMDGRSVYSPLHSGVFWHIQDTLLEDIDRIEVIRGPGATLWGANAVNGVINIITKHSSETQGGLVTAGGGTEERGFGSFRYGARSGDDKYYRVYAKYFTRDEAVFSSGDDATDDWDSLRGGFRVDRQIRGGDSLTFQGDIYDGKVGERIILATPSSIQTYDGTTAFNGVSLLGRWERSLSDASNLSLQVYYDRTDLEIKRIDEIRDTFDIDFQHHFLFGERHGIMWGVGYRFTRDNIDNSSATIFTPDRRHVDLWSAFLQDDISLVDDIFRLTVGSKIEYNDYTGIEIQPNIRLIWTPKRSYSIWAAVSRAVRTPSRAENDVMSYYGLPSSGVVFPVCGSSDFDSEELIAYELGFRILPVDQLSIDIAAYYSDYDNLRTVELGGAFPDVRLVMDNKMEGSTYGVELAVDWRVFDWWRLMGAYSFLQMQLHPHSDSRDPFSELAEGDNPHHQASLRSSMDLRGNLELDLWTHYVDNLPSQGVGSYVALDIRLGWKPRKDLELSIVGQNLLDSQHPEFFPEILDTTPTEVERGVYGKITWKF